MQRLYDFLRGHPTGVDTFWAVLLLGFSSLWVMRSGLDRSERLADLVCVLAWCTAVALRRRRPREVLVLAVVAGLGQLVAGIPTNAADCALLVVIYTAASGTVRWASRCALAVAVAGPTLALVRFRPDQPYLTSAQLVVNTVMVTLPFVLAWVLGDSVRTRRAYWAQLEERADRLERERETRARIAVTAERARIARELHDVVAHNVSVMVVQADGAAYVMDNSPDQARKALETISGTGRQALGEMRRLLGVLRDDDRPENGEYVPQPGMAQLTDLVEQVRATGLPVDFRVEGEPRPLPSGLELTAYRIVQEALTNTRKHGGPEAGATVRLTYDADDLSLLVEDDGRGTGREVCVGGGADGLGQGLIGMRERVGMVGGSLETGPRPGGGFRIRVSLPLGPRE
ncbi:histidine kinase [Streptomyces sp. NPDC059740]|uniref:DUF7134 domain-containing protein n=1 Tax=Streptomyces sp. NPDC059740 TaxID=3346926 RepID=UPI003665F989